MSEECKEIRISIIIPLRLNEAHGDAIDRLDFLAEDTSRQRYVRVMVVDDGSPEPFAARLHARCLALGFEHVRLDTEHETFSIGRCRNEGAMRATTRYIFFQDIDLIPPDAFYEKLAREIDIVGLPQHANNMIMIPVGYLTEAATKAFLADRAPDKFQRYLDRLIHRDRSVFEKFSTGTSACLYDRYYYLSCGGNRPQFSGWGYEDLEFNNRVVIDSGRYPIPLDWPEDISSFDLQSRYQGWKSAYRLFGDRSFYKGLVLFHAWHPVNKDTSYRNRKEINRKLFVSYLKAFQKNQEHPPVLPAPECGKTLLFRENAFTFARELQPLLGEVVIEDEYQFQTRDEFCSHFQQKGYTRIVFHNPYSTDQMQQIYSWSRDANLPFVVAERGALNNSILFDTTGFLADSTLLLSDYWDKPIECEAGKRLTDYIQAEKSKNLLLEAQGKRSSPENLRVKFKLNEDDHVILICLQRPGDTATRFFNGGMGTYQDFIGSLEKLSSDIPGNYKLLVKKHPLEDVRPDIKGIPVDDYHLYDLFSISDKLIVFNSGTGVQAFMFDLPVITCGKAFFAHKKLTCHVNTYNELKKAITENSDVNVEARHRFLSYLIEKYYSFGEFQTRQKRMENSDRMTVTTKILYHVLRFEGFEGRYYRGTTPLDNWQSMLFDRYQGLGDISNINFFSRFSLSTIDQMAIRLYRASRTIPIINKIIDMFVPFYNYIKHK